MKISNILAALLTAGICNAAWAQSTEGHSGHSGSGGNDAACIKAKISRYKPEHLATVAPGSEFSFAVSGSNGPGHIHVSIREEPLELSVEDKDTFYLVKGKLPPALKNQTVRLSIKAKAKVGKCDANDGLLLKITE